MPQPRLPFGHRWILASEVQREMPDNVGVHATLDQVALESPESAPLVCSLRTHYATGLHRIPRLYSPSALLSEISLLLPPEILRPVRHLGEIGVYQRRVTPFTPRLGDAMIIPLVFRRSHLLFVASTN